VVPLIQREIGNDAATTAPHDSELRVVRRSGLRVLDASMIPDTMDRNINSAVMIAERAADIIRSHSAASVGRFERGTSGQHTAIYFHPT
jgi:choline dehydrogenase-like flavoprotein